MFRPDWLSIVRGRRTRLQEQNHVQRLFKLEAGRGEAGFDLFKKNRETVGLVILDALMPKMSGNEACEMIQGLEPDVFPLFISGYNENVIPTDFIQKLGLEYFQKPFSGAEILLKIRDILES